MSRAITASRAGRCSLFTVDRESEQNISRRTAGGYIARVDVEHPATDNGARSIERSATARDSVDGGVGLFRIKIPDDLSVGCSVRAKMAINGARKRNSPDCRHRRGLSGAAPWPLTTGRRRSKPNLLPIRRAQGEHASAAL